MTNRISPRRCRIPPSAASFWKISALRSPIKGVILDMEMPVVHGVEVLRRLKNQYPDLPILMISAGYNRVMLDEAMRSGANAYLAKPFDRKQLIEVCTALFRSRPDRPANASAEKPSKPSMS